MGFGRASLALPLPGCALHLNQARSIGLAASLTSRTTARMGFKPVLRPPPTTALHHYRHRAAATWEHRGTARGFLPRGLSNTCPLIGAMRSVSASPGQVSNKPKQKRTVDTVAQLNVCLPRPRTNAIDPEEPFSTSDPVPESGRRTDNSRHGDASRSGTKIG